MTRPAIPSAVRRQLRQEAGFGCCVCGHPFIQYHHIVSWAEEQHFRPEDMMVLCGNHHHLATVGALETSDQRTAKLRPKNVVDGMIKGSLFVTSKSLTVHLAGGIAVDTPRLLDVSGQTLLAAKLDDTDGRVLVSAKIHDRDGLIVAEIRDNEWSMAPGDVWDFEAFPRHARVLLGPAEIAFTVDTRDDQVAFTGKWFHHGTPIVFTPKMAAVGSNRLFGMNVTKCGGFLAVG